MESLDVALTYAIDLTMALGAGYIGTAFVIYMIDRWNEIEVKPKLKQTQKVRIPLNLKAADTIPLELEQQDLSVAAIPLEPIITPAPERQEVRTIEPVTVEEPEILAAPEIPEPKLAESAEESEAFPAAEVSESELAESAEESEASPAAEISESELFESAEEAEIFTTSEISESELFESEDSEPDETI